MNVLIVINDAPYGTEKAYNALRITLSLQKGHKDVEIRLFLLADVVGCAIPNQKTPQGYYTIERMLKSVIGRKGKVKACGGCSEARGIANLSLIEGVEISNMKELSQWILEATKIMIF